MSRLRVISANSALGRLWWSPIQSSSSKSMQRSGSERCSRPGSTGKSRKPFSQAVRCRNDESDSPGKGRGRTRNAMVFINSPNLCRCFCLNLNVPTGWASPQLQHFVTSKNQWLSGVTTRVTPLETPKLDALARSGGFSLARSVRWAHRLSRHPPDYASLNRSHLNGLPEPCKQLGLPSIATWQMFSQ